MILIDIENPTCCSNCPLIFEYFSTAENKQVFHCSGRLEGESRFADDFDINTKPDFGCPILGEIPNEHGNIIDANDLIEHYEALAADNGVYTEDAEETVETIKKIPKVILKGNVEA